MAAVTIEASGVPPDKRNLVRSETGYWLRFAGVLIVAAISFQLATGPHHKTNPWSRPS
jgi:hypothetical protein